jgi:hypothetical protein
MRADVVNERVLSAILEFRMPAARAPAVLRALAAVAEKINTVMSVNIGARLEPDGSNPAETAAQEAGFTLRPNGKTNLGLGKPNIDERRGGK